MEFVQSARKKGSGRRGQKYWTKEVPRLETGSRDTAPAQMIYDYWPESERI